MVATRSGRVVRAEAMAQDPQSDDRKGKAEDIDADTARTDQIMKDIDPLTSFFYRPHNIGFLVAGAVQV